MSILFYENANPWYAIIRKLIFTHHSILNYNETCQQSKYEPLILLTLDVYIYLLHT
jgi:hypothetical protein